MTIITTSDSSFEADVLKSSVPVVVDFWAEWCGPCKMIAPFLEELAADKGDQVVVAKVNIDDNPLTPTNIGVRGIPTLMLFRTARSRRPRWAPCPRPSCTNGSTSRLRGTRALPDRLRDCSRRAAFPVRG